MATEVVYIVLWYAYVQRTLHILSIPDAPLPPTDHELTGAVLIRNNGSAQQALDNRDYGSPEVKNILIHILHTT